MTMYTTSETIKNSPVRRWGLDAGNNGELMIGGCSTLQLCRLYGTPLHVVNEERLANTATAFSEAIRGIYPGKVSVHYAFKCNPVPGIIKILKNNGLNAETMSEHELFVALKLGYCGHEIVVNGPFKTDRFLTACIKNNVRFINIDSLSELERLNKLCADFDLKTEVLLRINPDYIPTGMNKGSATAGRRGSPFGLDMKGGEVHKAIESVKKMERIRFRGFHFHIGSGIRNTDDFRRAIARLKDIVSFAGKSGLDVEVLDIGGGLGVPDSREMTTFEMLMYQAFDLLPFSRLHKKNISFGRFADSVNTGVKKLFNRKDLPELILEPGRCITSPNQILLLRIHQVKERKGIKKWLITDAGIGTLTMPTFYEHHEIFLCNDVGRKPAGRVTITGPGCFAADIVYRNKKMPDIKPDEIIAVMDSGAYFTSWESSFGFPRPAIVAASNGSHRILRQRETSESMISLDTF